MDEQAPTSHSTPSTHSRGSGGASSTFRNELSKLIRSGLYAPGDRLPTERALMERFGVSRSVVREAITDLANKGLLKTRPGCRPVVSMPDYDVALGSLTQFVSHLISSNENGIWNLFETRMFVEAGLARWAAQHARKEHILDLQTALEKNYLAIGSRGDFEKTDIALHHVLYTIPRNPIYPAIHRAYVDWLYEHWHAIDSSPELDRVNYAGHAAIVAAIISRDPDVAEDAVRRHLNAAWEYVRATFQVRRGD
jgi:DNA-binding FadR family transcriptional regulator